MGTTVQLYPTAQYQFGGGTDSLVGGAASSWQALDANLATGVAFLTGAPVLRLNCAALSLPAGSTIYGVRVKALYSTGINTVGIHLRLENTVPQILDLTPNGRIVVGGDQLHADSGWALLDPAGNPWTQALVNSSIMALTDDGSGGGYETWWYAYLEVLYYAKPVVSGVSPSGTGGDGQPTVTWSINGDGLSQSYKQVKVFSSAQYSAGGFDPETSAAVYDSGVVSGSDTSHRLSTPLPSDAAYRIYVKAATTVGSTLQYNWSTWQYSSYTLDRAPNIPTLASPAPGTKMDVSGGVTFVWGYSHPDASINQGAYALRRKTDGGAYQYWRESDQTWQASIQWNSTANQFKTFGAGIFTNGHTYAWSINVQDSDGDASGFPADSTFTSNSKPVVNVTAPTGTVTNNSRPTVTWSYSDADADPQDSFQVKVWAGPLYSGFTGSFPWDGWPATYDSGTTVGSSKSFNLPVDLDNLGNTWVIGVRAKGGGQWSDWAASFVTMALDGPYQPDLTAVLDSANARATLTAQGHANMLPTDDADFESGIGTWVNQSAAGSLARNGSDATHGSSCLGFSSTAAGTVEVRTASGTAGVAVRPSTAYTVRADVKPTSVARSFQLVIRWYQANGAASAITPVSTSTSQSTSLNTWQTNKAFTATSPSDAAFAAVGVQMLSAAAAGETYRIDKAGLCIGTMTSAWWSRGGIQFGANADFTFEYSDDNVTWYPVRNGSFVSASNNLEAVTIYDYEIPARTTRYYRAKAISTQATGAILVSAVSTTQNLTWSPQSMWIKDIIDPTHNMAVKILSDEFNQKRPLNAGKFYTQGQTQAVVVSESAFRSRDWDMTIQVTTKAQEAALDALMQPGRTLLLQDVIGENTYFKLSDASERNVVKSADLTLPRAWAWNKKYACTEVIAPSYP